MLSYSTCSQVCFLTALAAQHGGMGVVAAGCGVMVVCNHMVQHCIISHAFRLLQNVTQLWTCTCVWLSTGPHSNSTYQVVTPRMGDTDSDQPTTMHTSGSWFAPYLDHPHACPDLTPGSPVASMDYGGYSEYAVLRARRTLPVPRPTPEAVALLTSGMTASIALAEVRGCVGVFVRGGA